MKPDEDMPLNDMLRLGLEKHINLLKDISSRASKEFALEKVSIIRPEYNPSTDEGKFDDNC